MGSDEGAFEVTGHPPPAALADARVALHWAVQLPAAVARAVIPPVPDDSHTSLVWLPEPRVLAGAPVGAAAGLRVGVRPADLVLVVLDGSGTPTLDLPLVGRTFDEALAWLARTLGLSPRIQLSRPPYEMPAHPVASGAAFGAGDASARLELGRWYASANAVLTTSLPRLTDVVAARAASPVRCWPHHFDLATLLTMRGEGRTVGVGLSPGDASYPQPYWYVTPWPYPELTGALPALPAGGLWHSAGWFGAVLLGQAWLDAPAPSGRTQVIADFLEQAVRSCATVLSPA